MACLDRPKSIDVLLRWVAGLFAGEVEADDAAMRKSIAISAHSSESVRSRIAQMIRPHSTPYFSSPRVKAIDRRLHDRFRRQAESGVKARREARFGIDDAIAVHVLDELKRHTLDRLAASA